jgi:hypothetical protein
LDPISNLDPVLEALRRQLAQNIERLRKAGQLASSAPGAASGARAAAAENLEAMLRRRLSAIDKRSSEGRVRATRAFVEAVLAREFGESLLADPGAGDMVNEIATALRDDAQTRERLDQLLAGFA